jgi:phage major head subunit gpT-like protein
MSGQGLGSRAIIGRYFARLEVATGMSWIPQVAMQVNSDQSSEEYKWLGMSPAMREWVGGRNAKGFRENGITIVNKHYEATMKALVKELRRDKTGQMLIRIGEMADRTAAHPASLLSTLIKNGASAACYDGSNFFATNHSEGDSGTQSNAIQVQLTTLPVTNRGTPDNPTVAEMQYAILKGIAQILSFKDDQGEPMNEMARNFMVMVPTRCWAAAEGAVSVSMVDSGAANLVPANRKINISVELNTRLDDTFGLSGSPETTEFVIFRTDGVVKPFIHQIEQDVMMKVIAEGSELEFNDDEHHYGVDKWENVGYGYWQHSCKVELT